MKKKLFPRSIDPLTALFDQHKNLITDPQGIKNVIVKEFQYRLRNREIDENLQDLRKMKEHLCELRLEITRTNDFRPWSMENLNASIKRLMNNKSKDPHGHINEMYKFLGEDGKQTLLMLLNMIKEQLLIPTQLNLSNVTTIYKGKGSKQEVINLRGIFKLAIIRNILDRMVYFDEQKTIKRGMGQHQVGNQKGRSIRDNTFILHAIVNEARENKTSIDIQFTDIAQCFDSIWLQEAVNDLYTSGVISRNLNLLFEGNRKTFMAVVGRIDRVKLTKMTKMYEITKLLHLTIFTIR